MYDLVTFGEMLLRLGAPGFQRIEQAPSFDVVVTGGEMNAAVVAARFGLKTAHVTRLPRNPLGRMVENKVREHGIDTSHFVWSQDGRVGLFFLEAGAMPRPSSVVYDRANSEMSKIRPGEVDWDAVFKGTKLFHVSGTAPALSLSAAEVTREALIAAKKHGVTVSFDMNYRAKLWSLEECRKTISALLEFVDILITGEGDIHRIFQIRFNGYQEAAAKMQEKFNLQAVVLTMREEITVWRNNWTAVAYANGTLYDDVTYQLDIVDRVGGGDAFTGGFLYAYAAFDKDLKKCLQYGNASCALKHTIPGDLNWATRQETEELIRRGPEAGTNLRINR
jgi:2-dehydro-3-deoxygluconokinase